MWPGRRGRRTCFACECHALRTRPGVEVTGFATRSRRCGSGASFAPVHVYAGIVRIDVDTMRAHRIRRDRARRIALPLPMATVFLWAVLGEHWLEPLKTYDHAMFWSIGLFLVLVELVVCTYVGEIESD